MATPSKSARKSNLVAEIATRSLERARAWRFVLATRVMGVRPMDDQASGAIRDMFDALITMRCEIVAIRGALLERGVLDADDVMRRMGEAAEEIVGVYTEMFPGLWVDDEGMIRFDENGYPAPDTTEVPN